MNKMELRYAKLRAKMDELGLDAIYVSSPENHLYVTDFDNPDGYAFLTKDAAWVFADSRYIEAAKAEATPLCTVCLPGQPGLLEIVKERGIKVIGYEDRRLTCAALENLLSISGVAGGVFDILFQMIDAIYDIVMASGIQIIVFLSGLQSISPSLYEAADVEGCSAWESFWKITFPMVSPLLLVNCIYTIIDFFMKNNNQVMEHINNIYMNGVRMDLGIAAAESWIYFAVAIVFIGISAFIISRAVKSYE